MLAVLCAWMLFAMPPQSWLPPSGGSQAQQSQNQQQSRDVATTDKKGTAVIRGKVTTLDNRPIRRVKVTASAPELTESRSVSTNAHGVYEIRDLPAARYTLTASRSGYLTLRYGQQRPREGARPVEIADGQTAEHVDFALPRMAVIAGRISDEVGEPAANVMVLPMQSRYFQGKRRLVPISGGVRTDDTGQYRLIGLEPGDYYVMAWTRETWPVEGNPQESIGYAYTYYGGTATIADAQRIKVDFGKEISAVDFSLVPGRVVTISGTATSASGMPLVGESISVAQEFSGPMFSSVYSFAAGGKINADGTFTLRNMAPGDYKLSVRLPGDKDHPPEGAAVTISVAGADIEGVNLVTGATGTISGRVITDTGEIPPFGSTRPRVWMQPLDRSSTYQTYAEDNGRVKDDGTFDFTGAMGLQQMFVWELPKGYAVRSIDYDGHDYAGMPIEIRNGQKVEGVTVVLSNKMPTLRGTVRDEKLRPVAATVILFPEEPSQWTENSSRIRTARPDQAGVFEFTLVPPGDYLIAPAEYVGDGDWNDPEFLQGLKERATKVSLGELRSEPIALTLKKES